jgi:predicted ribosomally synthesized peptide with SipW-like signal peptide
LVQVSEAANLIEKALGPLGSVPDTPLPLPQRAGRYHLMGELARGGMGAVLRAYDPDLRRPLAIKVMLAEQLSHAGAEQRFLEEAQVTGQLQHPGVPPVHEVGRLDDGRPFIAMKLIEGRTLEQLLKERPSPADDLPRFVAIFAQVCQTIAYAHSRGVLHRDLKPSNVIVGAFGEVQVMDWGLAKVLADPTVAETVARASSVVHTVRSGGLATATWNGEVMGTPNYMPPEQARGDVDRLDERTDVFGLGALLCQILTGAPPFRGSDSSTVLRQAARADLDDALARLRTCGAEAELVELARRCLAAERGQRPPHAGAVADPVAAHQAGVQERLKRAELERARAEVKTHEERKRRRLTLALAAAVIALVALGGTFAWWSERKQAELERQEAGRLEESRQQQAREQEERARREESARQRVLAALREAQALWRRALWQEAAHTLTRANGLAAEHGLADLTRRIEQARADLRFAERLNRISEDKALIVEGKLNNASAPPAYAKAFAEHGLRVLATDPDQLARRIVASPLREEMIAALDDWAFTERDASKRSRLWRLTAAVKPGEPWRKRLAAPDVWGDRRRWQRLLAEADVERLSPRVLGGLGARLDALGGDGLAVLEKGCLRHPGDFWLNFELANLLGAKSRWDAAAAYYRAALAARPGSAVTCNNLGVSFCETRDLEKSIIACRRAIALDPRLGMAYCNLGRALCDSTDLDGSLAACTKAVELDPRDAVARVNLGVTLFARRDLDGAVAAFRRAVALAPDLALAWSNLGNALRESKDLDGAVTACRKAVDLDPNLANAHTNLGLVLRERNDLDGALMSCRRAVKLAPRSSLVHSNLGAVLLGRKELAAAVTTLRKAIDLDPGNARAHFGLGVALYQQNDLAGTAMALRQATQLDRRFALAHYFLGQALCEHNDLAEAVAVLRRAAELNPCDADTHAVLCTALADRKDLEGAIAAGRRATALDANNARAWSSLGNALRSHKDLDDAIAALRRATVLAPTDAKGFHNLGGAFYDKKDLKEAIIAYRRAIALNPAFAGHHAALGVALRDRKDLVAAAAAFRKAAELEPRKADHCILLAAVEQERGRFSEATEAARRALALLPADHQYRGALTQLVEDCEGLRTAEGHLAAVLKGDPPPADARQLLRLARLSGQYKHRHATAVRFYAAAFTADPELAETLVAGHRLAAARSAALASAGQGVDAAGPEAAKARLRQRALDWLRADLAAWTRLADDALFRERTRQALLGWQKDTDLAAVRDAARLALLPDAERGKWRQFWQDVADLLHRIPAPQ